MKNNIEITVKSGLIQNIAIPAILKTIISKNDIRFTILDYDINGTSDSLHKDAEGKKYIEYDFSLKGS